MSERRASVAVIIPALNEEQSIRAVIDAIPEALEADIVVTAISGWVGLPDLECDILKFRMRSIPFIRR